MLLNTIKVLPAHLLSRTAYLRIAKERTTVGGVIAIADVASIAEKKANCVRRAIHPRPKGRGFSRNSGKRSGVRVIYFNRLEQGFIVLLAVYAKNEQDNMATKTIRRLKDG